MSDLFGASERTKKLAMLIIDGITRERLRGMQVDRIWINTDDYAAMVLENNGKPVQSIGNIPLGRRGDILPGFVSMTSAGPA